MNIFGHANELDGILSTFQKTLTKLETFTERQEYKKSALQQQRLDLEEQEKAVVVDIDRAKKVHAKIKEIVS